MKKKILSFLLMLLVVLSVIFPCTAAQTENPASETTAPETEAKAVILPTDEVTTEDIVLYSAAACVMDADTGRILYAKNMDDKHYPASITKVLTGLVLIENSSLSDVITFHNDCWDGINYYSDMNVGMLDGEQLTVDQALHCILMASANEVCNGAAIHVAGSIPAFVDMMNERAAQLGCENTHFVTPNGLHDENHYTTAHDMALIARECIKNAVFRRITGTREYTVKKTNMRKDGFPISQKHKMLMYTDFHYDACIGGKTGYTTEARNTLITFAEKNGMSLVSVVMYNADGHIYPDTIMALDYCFDHFSKQSAPALENRSDLISTALPFAGVGIDTFNVTTDHTDSTVITSQDASETFRTEALQTADTRFLAPYRSLVYQTGTLQYLTQDGQMAGSRRILASLPDFTLTDMDEALAAAAVAREESGSADEETALADARRGEPTYIQLQDPVVSDKEPVFLPLKPENIPHILQHLPDYAGYYLMLGEAYIIFHPFYSFIGLAIFFIVLTFFMIRLYRAHKRRRHRRNYRKMREKRLNAVKR
jgi:D-alanyl-D-alanine carboxypeptidase